VFVGPSNPTYFGSILNSFNYRDFEVSFNITYKFNYFLMKPTFTYSFLANNYSDAGDYSNRWQKPGDEKITNVPSFVYPFDDLRNTFYAASEANIIKGDHVRLQFINLAYNIPKIKNLKNCSAQIYVNASNLGILWKANKFNIDPDFARNIPDPKTYTLGVRINF